MNTSIILKNINSIAIGGFDGMHIGHQVLFKHLNKEGIILQIDTGYSNLTPNNKREEHTYFSIFKYKLEDIKHLEADGFIKRLYSDFPNLKKIIIGYDFKFGKNRKYSAVDLKNLFKGEVKIIEEIIYKNYSVHSSLIREKLKKGDIKIANELLGYIYNIDGDVIKGQGIGTKNFVPTINIKSDSIILKEGVYASVTILENTPYPSVTFFGHRKTTDNNLALETHIINKTIKKKYSTVRVEFLRYMRENKKFTNFEALRDQILEDILNRQKINEQTMP